MRTLVLLTAIFLSNYSFSQRIGDFSVFQSDGNVGIRFVISPGPTCNGFDILHSTDSLTYTTVYPFMGTCGDSYAPEVRTWTHENPVYGQMNYYKIQLRSPYEMTDARKIMVMQGGRNPIIPFPNPIIGDLDILNLRIYNTNNTRLVGFLYDRFGRSMGDLDLRTAGEIASINIADLTDGLYVVWLTEGENLFTCKFIVKR